MIKITKERAIILHKMLSSEAGTHGGVRDEGLLESALNSPFHSFDGCELYPTVYEKAARLGFSLISNHPFFDGNKRIGMLCMLVFLKVNSIEIVPQRGQVFRAGISLASGEMNYEELLKWVKSITK